MARRKILHIINALGVGGAEKLLVGMINGLADYDQHVMVLSGPDQKPADITVPCHYINLNCPSWKQLFMKRGYVRHYIKEQGIDIVHSHLYEANLLARISTPRSTKLINSIHAISSLASYKINRLTQWLEKWSYRKRHILIAVSKAVLDDFDKWIGVKGKAYVLYNYIDDRFFQPGHKIENNGKALKLVSVGNLRYQKNYMYLLQAFREMPVSATLDIFGEGTLRNELQNYINEHQLPVELKGIRDDLEKVLPGYDAFVMSSFYEGQPLSLLEASACGLPSMLSDIPVLKEVLGKDAAYFDINNTRSFGLLVKDISEGKMDLDEMAHAAREKVGSFAHRAQYLEKLRAIYNEAMA